MDLLSREARLVQNPALGAVLIWRFACGYSDKHPTKAYAPLPLSFIVLPIVLHSDAFADLKSTRSGLRAFVDKFNASQNPRSDVVLAIHDRVAAWRSLSLASLRISIRSRLVTLLPTHATVMPLSKSKPSGIPESIRPLLSNAEKMGSLLSQLSLFEISSTLRIRF